MSYRIIFFYWIKILLHKKIFKMLQFCFIIHIFAQYLLKTGIIMKKVELFIKERNIKISEIERELNLPNRSIQFTGKRGIPSKYIEDVTNLLVSSYGYIDENSESEVDIPFGKPEKEIKINYRWNRGFVPNYEDGILRYQDPENGLWRRLLDYQGYEEKDANGKKTGNRNVKDAYLPKTGELLLDEIGEYYLAKNGIRVYSFKKK